MTQKNCGHNHTCGCANLPQPNIQPSKQDLENFEKDTLALKEDIQKIEIADRRKKPMAHLHLHTFHSILDGAGSIDNYIKLAKEYNHPAIAVTDHGTVSGLFEFWQKCKNSGIKPILGMEAYVNNNMGEFEEKKYEGGNAHQSIFIKNQEGFVNLNKLAYKSFSEGFYKRGRIKTDWLIEHKNGLFLTTSCCASVMADLIFKGKENEAEEYLKLLMREFGENLVAEIQLNEFEDNSKGYLQSQKVYNSWIIKMCKKYSLMPILTNDVHYAFSKDAELQDTLIAINQKSKLGESFRLSTRNLFYANADDFHDFNKKFGYNYQEKFIDFCLENTLKVVEKCSYDFEVGKEKYPRYEPTKDVLDYFKTDDAKDIISKLGFAKLKQKLKKYKENNIVQITDEVIQQYNDRLKYEIDVIDSKKMIDYFLVNWEIIRFCKDNDIATGPGRGSAAGCLLSWCLDITKIDPIRFDLYFERFLNPSRNSPPDIDIDYEAGTDDKTTQFLYDKYGKERVLNVSTFSTFNEKMCLKDVVKAHFGEDETGFDSDVHAVTQEMPNFDKVDYSLNDWFEDWPKNTECSEKVKNWLTNPRNKKILEQTLQFQGQIRGIGQHPAGIVITPSASWEHIPTNIIASNKSIVTAFQEADKSGKDLSTLGILKLDRLKLETLNVIKDAIKIIKEKRGIDVQEKVDYVDLNDPNLFLELRLGLNHGVFQFESSGMNALIRGMAVENFEEVVAANALYRPGPMGIKAHEDYIRNKFHPEEIKYIHPALESILSKTNGVLIFQEQMMFIAHKIGGMSLGEGEMLRRYMDKASSAISKKSKGEVLNKKEEDNYKEFEKYWNKFLSGAEKNGYKANEVDVIKDWVIKYLGYSFNRSHSVSYGYLAMQTLFLKHYYPTEFYTALLNHPKDNGKKEKVQEWLASSIASAMSKGIKISSPSRKSGWDWTNTGDREISMGFSGINGVGEIAYEELMTLIKNKNKTLETISMGEFFELPFSKFNKKSFESCVKAGVFDDWSDSREHLFSLKEKKKKKTAANQVSLFDMGSEEFNIKLDNHNYPQTLPGQKINDFMEVCNFDLRKIENITKIKNHINKISKIPLENIINFEEENWYFFILEDFQKLKSQAGNEYFVLKVGDGISNTKLRAFNPFAKKIEPELERDRVYVAKFEKNKDGFINFKKGTQFKRIEINFNDERKL